MNNTNICLIISILLLVGLIFNMRTEKFYQESQCVFVPSGEREIDCVRECYDKRTILNCSVDECLSRCAGCTNTNLCKWRKPLPKALSRPQPSINFDKQVCSFEPYGISEKNCREVCSGPDRFEWGGDKCDILTCDTICNSCKDETWCWWLKEQKLVDRPGKPLIFGNSSIDKITLYWTPVSVDDIDYIIMKYEKNDPNNTLQLNKLTAEHLKLPNSENKENNYIKYSFPPSSIKSNTKYNFYVIAKNNIGLSLPSNEITLETKTPSDLDINEQDYSCSIHTDGTGCEADSNCLWNGETCYEKPVNNNNQLNQGVSSNPLEFREFSLTPEQRQLVKSMDKDVSTRSFFDNLKGKTLDITL